MDLRAAHPRGRARVLRRGLADAALVRQLRGRGRDPERGAALVKTVTGQGGAARFQDVDLADPDSLRSLVEAAGEVDILVDNAAVFPMGPTISSETGLDDEAFETASFDAGDRAAYVTGTIVAADGGRTAI